MPKLPVLSSKKLLAILQKAGFETDHITGSHYILYNTLNNKRLTIPFHRGDLPKGTVFSILKSAEIPVKDLKKYM